MKTTKILFATDLHGSNVCLKKFAKAGEWYGADVIILGGDTTGKMVIPILEHENGTFESFFLGKQSIFKSKEKITEHEKVISNSGFYPYRVTKAEYEELESNKQKVNKSFLDLMIERWKSWIQILEAALKGSRLSKCYICPGNDDPFEIDYLFESTDVVVNTEGKVIDIDGSHEMISTGWTNPTPWHTPRECSEEELSSKIDEMASQVKNMENCIFNLHAPPFGSGLDTAPKLDEDLRPLDAMQTFVPVGSKAAHAAIESYQPLLGLHGHIHEAKGAHKIGRTLCVNPGSQYGEGYLNSYLIIVDEKRIKHYIPATG